MSNNREWREAERECIEGRGEANEREGERKKGHFYINVVVL